MTLKEGFSPVGINTRGLQDPPPPPQCTEPRTRT